MVNSKKKGSRGELEFAKFLTAQGFPSRRGQQFSGSPDSPDVVTEDDRLNLFHIEVKRTERLNIRKAIEQADKDRGLGKAPIIAHRSNRSDWLVTLKAKDLLDIIRVLFEAFRGHHE